MFYYITVAKEWKKREVIKNRNELKENVPSFLNYIAGKKNGRSVVVIFLKDNEGEKAKDYFTKNSEFSRADCEVVNVNVRRKYVSSFRAEPKPSESERKLLQNII